MIGVAICGGLFCAFAAGYCMGYVIHKQRPKLPLVPAGTQRSVADELGRGSTYLGCPQSGCLPAVKRDALGRYAK